MDGEIGGRIHDNWGLFTRADLWRRDGERSSAPVARGAWSLTRPDSIALRTPIRDRFEPSTATFHGATLTCVLLSRSRNSANPALGRGWEETEECIDPQSGLLQVHSEVPGRYAVYDYSDAPNWAIACCLDNVTVH